MNRSEMVDDLWEHTRHREQRTGAQAMMELAKMTDKEFEKYYKRRKVEWMFNEEDDE